MDFQLNEEHLMVKDLVAKFVQNELMPLEPKVLEREAQGQSAGLTDEELEPLYAKCKEIGLWGLDVPEEVGGANLPPLALVGINEELYRTITPFTFPPDSPNLHMMLTTANDAQKAKYLAPYARGETISAIAISEPGAGADPAGMMTRAVKDGDDWVINGRKIWISRAPAAAFTILMAVTDPEKGSRGGISAFIIDKGTPGFIIEREIPMIGGNRTYEIVLENCRVADAQLLGELGEGFAPMQLRLNVRRLQMGAWCLGMSRRALEMMCEHVKERVTFGQKLADRQSIQWWIADAATKMKSLQLMLYEAAWKQEQGHDIRTEASMIKAFGTEMAAEIVDNAQQSFGAMGVTKELPFQLMASRIRTMRVYEGPTEVHRWVIARRVLRDGLPF